MIRKLYAGVKIPCELQIDIELDENNNPIEGTEKYTIIKVTGDIIEPKGYDQLSIDIQ